MKTIENALIVLAATLFAGCQGESSGPQMADVSGKITLDGKPLTDAEVFFVVDGFQGYGRTNEEGRYTLVRGAPVGDCKVYITKVPENPNGNSGGIDLSIEGMDEEQMRAMASTNNPASRSAAIKPLLPPEYSDPKQTRLSINVPPEGTEDANFNL